MLLTLYQFGLALAFWIYTIVRETQDAINMKSYKNKIPLNDDVNVLSRETNHRPFTDSCPGPEVNEK